MTLTASQLVRLRQMSGGIVGNTERDYLTDQMLQEEYTAAGGDFERAVVGVLRLRVGMTAAFVDKKLDLNSEQLSQRHKHLLALLAYWEGRTGDGGALITTGNLDMNIDTDAADVRLHN